MFQRSSLFRPVLVAATLLAFGVGLAPVMAADDGSGSILSGLMGIAGMDQKPDPDIAYRERPPLVVPPRDSLPQPQRRVSRTNPAWPKDPDAIARREARHPGAFNFIPKFHDQGRLMSQHDLMAHRLAPGAGSAVVPDQCAAGSRGRQCELLSPQQLAAFGKLPSAREVLTPGEEPTRGSLTDPPSGYRIPTHAVKETRVAPKENDDSQFAFIRDQAKK